jgi:AcrR family transcriptional regulator
MTRVQGVEESDHMLVLAGYAAVVTGEGDDATPRRRRSPNRRRQILSAAAAQFAEMGFHGVSVDDIGKVVGISGPALYHHFASKDALLAEVLYETSVVILAEGRRRVELADSPKHALWELIAWHTEFAVGNPSLMSVHMRDVASLSERDQQRVGHLQRDYVDVWVGVMTQEFGPINETKAISLVHGVHGLLNSVVRPHAARMRTEDMVATLHTAAFAAISGTLSENRAAPAAPKAKRAAAVVKPKVTKPVRAAASTASKPRARS